MLGILSTPNYFVRPAPGKWICLNNSPKRIGTGLFYALLLQLFSCLLSKYTWYCEHLFKVSLLTGRAEAINVGLGRKVSGEQRGQSSLIYSVGLLTEWCWRGFLVSAAGLHESSSISLSTNAIANLPVGFTQVTPFLSKETTRAAWNSVQKGESKVRICCVSWHLSQGFDILAK